MASRFGRKDFLEALFGEYVSRYDGFVRVTSVRHMDRKVSTRYFPKLETLSREQYSDNQHIFVGVCPHESMKPEKANIRYLVALWAGLDLTADGFSGKTQYFTDMSYAARAVRSFPLPPSIVIESGWGVHLYWLLKSPTEIKDTARVEKLLTTIGHYFQCGQDIGIDSALRLPDTFNCKVPSNVTRCSIKYLNGEFRYDLEEFEDLKLISVVPDHSNRDAALYDAGGLQALVDRKESAAESLRPGAFGDVSPGQGFTGQGSIPSEASGHAGVGSDPVANIAGHVSDYAARDRDAFLPEVTPVGLEEEAEEDTVVVVADSSADFLADEIVEKVVAKLSAELMEKLVDEIVEKLYKRITDTSPHK